MRLLPFLLLLPAVFAQDAALKKLEAEMERVSRIAGATVGATAIHIESGRTAHLNATVSFPMASTYKIPIAVTLLERVDRRQERLDRMVPVTTRDLHPGSGTLSQLFVQPGVSLSVRNLLELMLLISDNTATDILLRLAGGPAAVTAKMQELGLSGIRVDRPTALLIADYTGAKDLPLETEWSLAMWQDRLRSGSADAAAAFQSDPRDTATPGDMAKLLVRVHKRDLLRPETAGILIDILQRCRTGDARLKGLLPAGTMVAHKTGTMGTSVANDVGILTLPGNAGHVALAVYEKAGTKSEADRERAIAEIARAVHDFFLFQ